MPRPPVLGYLQSAVADNTAHSQMDRLLFEDEMDNQPQYTMGAPDYGTNIFGQRITEPWKFNPEDFMPVAMVGRLSKSVLKELKGIPGIKNVPKRFQKKYKNELIDDMDEMMRERDWPDVPLTHKSGDTGLSRKFLKEHGYDDTFNFMGDRVPKMANTFFDDGEKIITYTPYRGTKSGVQQKTFRAPTLLELRAWMGDQEGGLRSSYQEGGPAESSPSLYELLSGGLCAKEHREQSKKEAQAEREDTELLESRREAILP